MQIQFKIKLLRLSVHYPSTKAIGNLTITTDYSTTLIVEFKIMNKSETLMTSGAYESVKKKWRLDFNDEQNLKCLQI